jgi:hypothetical protein
MIQEMNIINLFLKRYTFSVFIRELNFGLEFCICSV